MVSVGDSIPNTGNLVRNSPDDKITLPSSGKYIIVGLPAAFSAPCQSQLPAYLEHISQFKSKGAQGIYIIAVNDFFVMKAWKDHQDIKDDFVTFVSDSTGEFTKAMGQLFDATGLLGNHRSKRYVAVVEDGKVKSLEVEKEVTEVTVTSADSVLKAL